MSQHLCRNHFIRNGVEGGILCGLANRRINMREEACPVPGCRYRSKRLDRHLKESHVEMSVGERELHGTLARRRKAMELLAELRTLNPDVLIQSDLD